MYSGKISGNDQDDNDDDVDDDAKAMVTTP